MEAKSIAPTLPPAAARPLAAVRRVGGRWALPAALLVLPLVYLVHDLSTGYPGFAQGHSITLHNLTYLGQNLVQGISNGAIWALVAIGYTLVYGIIELINFAHGDVFMIGSFTAAGFWGSIGLGLTTGPLGLVLGLLRDVDRLDAGLRLAERADRARRLPAAAKCAEAGAADHRSRLLVHPAERRPAVAGR